jgi:hypothetical protein
VRDPAADGSDLPGEWPPLDKTTPGALVVPGSPSRTRRHRYGRDWRRRGMRKRHGRVAGAPRGRMQPVGGLPPPLVPGVPRGQRQAVMAMGLSMEGRRKKMEG